MVNGQSTSYSSILPIHIAQNKPTVKWKMTMAGIEKQDNISATSKSICNFKFRYCCTMTIFHYTIHSR